MTFDEALYHIAQKGGTARLNTPEFDTYMYFDPDGLFISDQLIKDEILSEDWKVYKK